MRDPFALLGISPRFAIQAAQLRSAWMRRAASLHPDADGSVDESAAVNDAYRTLADPLARAGVLLALGHAPPGDERALPAGFLMELVELRERVDECSAGSAAWNAVRDEVRGLRSSALDEIGVLLDAPGNGEAPIDTVVAQSVRTAMNVVRSYDRVLEQLDREAGGPGAEPGGSLRP